MVSTKNNICVFCDSFILKGEKYSDINGCNHCKNIVGNMNNDNLLLNEDLDFDKYISVHNIPFQERIINV